MRINPLIEAGVLLRASRASERAAKIFEDNAWEWHNGLTSHEDNIPDAGDILTMYMKLLDQAIPDALDDPYQHSSARSGRLLVSVELSGNEDFVSEYDVLFGVELQGN